MSTHEENLKKPRKTAQQCFDDLDIARSRALRVIQLRTALINVIAQYESDLRRGSKVADLALASKKIEVFAEPLAFYNAKCNLANKRVDDAEQELATAREFKNRYPTVDFSNIQAEKVRHDAILGQAHSDAAKEKKRRRKKR
jgi:hypothetical protein